MENELKIIEELYQMRKASSIINKLSTLTVNTKVMELLKVMVDVYRKPVPKFKYNKTKDNVYSEHHHYEFLGWCDLLNENKATIYDVEEFIKNCTHPLQQKIYYKLFTKALTRVKVQHLQRVTSKFIGNKLKLTPYFDIHKDYDISDGNTVGTIIPSGGQRVVVVHTECNISIITKSGKHIEDWAVLNNIKRLLKGQSIVLDCIYKSKNGSGVLYVTDILEYKGFVEQKCEAVLETRLLLLDILALKGTFSSIKFTNSLYLKSYDELKLMVDLAVDSGSKVLIRNKLSTYNFNGSNKTFVIKDKLIYLQANKINHSDSGISINFGVSDGSFNVAINKGVTHTKYKLIQSRLLRNIKPIFLVKSGSYPMVINEVLTQNTTTTYDELSKL